MQARGGAGRAHDGSTRTMIGGPIEHQLQWVLDHPGVLGLLRGVVCLGFGRMFCRSEHHRSSTS